MVCVCISKIDLFVLNSKLFIFYGNKIFKYYLKKLSQVAVMSDKTEGNSTTKKDAIEISDTATGELPSEAASEEVPNASGAHIDSITRYLAEKLGFYKDDSEPKESTSKEKILSSNDLDGIAEFIQTNKCKNIITMAGAGISTAAGIPDFRSPVSGLYHNLQKYNLPHPQAIFELDFFLDNPRPFFELAKELYPGTFKPTVSHYFIRLLHQKGLLLRHYTQNIDTLERVAEVPDEILVEAHGTFHIGHCVECRKQYSQEWMKEEIFKDEIPMCTASKCHGIVKPDIVFFGENLPDKFHNLLKKDFAKCDLLIILGSSLAVQPFASLVDRVNDNCPRLLINRELAGERTGIMALMGMKGGLDFSSESNTKDVAWLGDCDAGCRTLAEKLGWLDELEHLYEIEHKRIDDENKGDEKETDEEDEPPPTTKL